VWVEDHLSEGEHLLFNTRTQALVKVNSEWRSALRSLGNQGSGIPAVLRAGLGGLTASGILVADSAQDRSKLADMFLQLKEGSGGLPFEATILTTYSCNFRCAYCFEDSVRGSVSMDGETARRVSDWLIGRAEARSYRRVHAVFYGGEPLLNRAPIFDISSRMRGWALRSGKKFTFSIITNGSLLSADLVDMLAPLGLSGVRVSVDGDRETHDRRRPGAGGEPTFDRIIANIKAVSGRTKVSVSGNFDRESFPGVLRLLDYLESEGLLRSIDSFMFAPVVPRLERRNGGPSVGLRHCFSFLEGEGLSAEILSLRRELFRRGLRVNSAGLAINACSMIMGDGGVTIGPEGDLYKCNSLVGHKEFSIGSVAVGDYNDKARAFLGADAWKLCPEDCPYVPMCQGGCRFLSYLENGDIGGVSCKRAYFDRIVPELIKLEYDIHALGGRGPVPAK